MHAPDLFVSWRGGVKYSKWDCTDFSSYTLRNSRAKLSDDCCFEFRKHWVLSIRTIPRISRPRAEGGSRGWEPGVGVGGGWEPGVGAEGWSRGRGLPKVACTLAQKEASALKPKTNARRMGGGGGGGEGRRYRGQAEGGGQGQGPFFSQQQQGRRGRGPRAPGVGLLRGALCLSSKKPTADTPAPPDAGRPCRPPPRPHPTPPHPTPPPPPPAPGLGPPSEFVGPHQLTSWRLAGLGAVATRPRWRLVPGPPGGALLVGERISRIRRSNGFQWYTGFPAGL
jgi:hypothetical protein